MVKYSKGRMIGGTMETVGLLAGIGILPVEFIEAAHMQGYKVVCIAVIPGTEKELKEKADYITTDCDKDGIYNACKHFKWID